MKSVSLVIALLFLLIPSSWAFTQNFPVEGGSLNLEPCRALPGFLPVRTAQDLMAIQDDLGANYYLCGDIDLSGFSWNPIAHDYDHPFTGIFEGNNHAIKNLSIKNEPISFIGLFGNIAGEIRNLILINPAIDPINSGFQVGSLAGQLRSEGRVENVHVKSGWVEGQFDTGGLVGVNKGFIRECSFQGQVQAIDRIIFPIRNHGGLVGTNHADIIDCRSSGLVLGTQNVGGLVGRNIGTGEIHAGRPHIRRCQSDAAVRGTNSVGGLVGLNLHHFPDNPQPFVRRSAAKGKVVTLAFAGGGLVGWNGNGCRIADCYSTAEVSGPGNSDIGGLVGSNEGRILRAYAAGSVFFSSGSSGGRSGGIVGHGLGGNPESLVRHSYWDIRATGQGSSVGGTGLDTDEMYQIETYASWSILPYGSGTLSIWKIDPRVDYPRLSWEPR